jgi:DNA-binding YbaB/EbfC family protein
VPYRQDGLRAKFLRWPKRVAKKNSGLPLRGAKSYDWSRTKRTKGSGRTMKVPGGFDLNSMMKQAQQMQEQMGREMKETVVDAAAGGGAVTVKMRGDFEVVELKISADLVKEGDVEMIQDLTVAALNEAHRKVEESLKGKLGGMLPPGLM